MAKFTTYIYPELNGVETEVGVVVDYDANYQPAKVSGPPEDCYPEDSEMTINSVTPDTPDWPEEIMNEIKSQEERFVDEAWEHYHSRGVDDGPEPEWD